MFVHFCVYFYVLVCVFVCVFVYICVYVYVYMCICVYVCVCVHRIWVPSFYMPPAEEFTVELWFQPACTVTNRTRGQILFRTLDPAAMLSPQVSIQGGNVVLEALLSDPVIPNQYFSALVRLEAPPPPPAAAGGDEGWGEWGSSSWHHIAFTVNVTHAAAYRNGTLVASQEIPNQVYPPDS